MKSNKKNNELAILEKIFKENDTFKVNTCEQPDFLLKYNNGNTFGVEITELYYDQTSARLNNKEGYVRDLIEKNKFIHKDDKKKLSVHEIKYYPRENIKNPVDSKMLFLPQYNSTHFRKSLYSLIKDKNEKLNKYSDEMTECLLIIDDRENRFNKLKLDKIGPNLFDDKIKEQVQSSKFYEIYLITVIDGGAKYIPLKAYLLLSDAYILSEYIKEKKLQSKMKSLGLDILDIYAEMLLHRAVSEVYGEVSATKKIVCYQRYAFGIDQGEELKVGIYDVYPQLPSSPDVKYVLDPENNFFSEKEYSEFELENKNKIASHGYIFDV